MLDMSCVRGYTRGFIANRVLEQEKTETETEMEMKTETAFL